MIFFNWSILIVVKGNSMNINIQRDALNSLKKVGKVFNLSHLSIKLETMQRGRILEKILETGILKKVNDNNCYRWNVGWEHIWTCRILSDSRFAAFSTDHIKRQTSINIGFILPAHLQIYLCKNFIIISHSTLALHCNQNTP